MGMENNAKQIKTKIEELRKQLPPHEKCSKCPNPLFNYSVSSDEEPYRIGGLPVCKECYFDALGEEVEKHPIGGYLMIDEVSYDSPTFRRRR